MPLSHRSASKEKTESPVNSETLEQKTFLSWVPLAAHCQTRPIITISQVCSLYRYPTHNRKVLDPFLSSTLDQIPITLNQSSIFNQSISRQGLRRPSTSNPTSCIRQPGSSPRLCTGTQHRALYLKHLIARGREPDIYPKFLQTSSMLDAQSRRHSQQPVYPTTQHWRCLLGTQTATDGCVNVRGCPFPGTP